MLVDIEWISRNYDYFNNLFWGGELPSCKFKTNMSSKTWGLASYIINRATKQLYNFGITLSNYWDSPEEVIQNTLIHEMIHIADLYFHPEHFINRRRYDAHGPEFFLKEAARIAPYGFDIAKYASQEEQSVSQLNPATKKKLERKAEEGTPIALYRGAGNNWFYVKYKSLNDLRRIMPYWPEDSYVICISHSEDAAAKVSSKRKPYFAGSSDSMCDIFVKMKVSRIIESEHPAIEREAEVELEKARRIMNSGTEEPQPEPKADETPSSSDEPLPPTVNDTPEVDTVDDVPSTPPNDMSRVYDKIENMLTSLLLDVNHGPKYVLHIDEDDPVRSFKPDLEIERSYLHGTGGGLYFGGFDITPCSSLSQLRDMLAFGESDKAVKMMFDKLSAYGLLKKKTDEMFFRGTLVEKMAALSNVVDTDNEPLDHVVGLTHGAQKKINDYEWVVAIE